MRLKGINPSGGRARVIWIDSNTLSVTTEVFDQGDVKAVESGAKLNFVIERPDGVDIIGVRGGGNDPKLTVGPGGGLEVSYVRRGVVISYSPTGWHSYTPAAFLSSDAG